MEVWKSVCGYEGVYEVSNKGRVKSLVRPWVIVEKILKPIRVKEPTGYIRLCVNLSKDGIHQKHPISVLMGVAFLGFNRMQTKLVVDHIDNDSTNNNLENLQVITQRENLRKDKVNPGVSYDKKYKKWKAYIWVNRHIHIGSYDTEEEAIKNLNKQLKRYGL